jgi:hypothetical protein
MNDTAVANRCQGPICVAGQSDRPRPGHERCPRRTSVSSTLQPFRHQSRQIDAERIRIGERLVSVGSTRRQQFGTGRCALRWDRPMSLTSNAQPAPDRHTAFSDGRLGLHRGRPRLTVAMPSWPVSSCHLRFASAYSSTLAEPMNPVAPVTETRVGNLPVETKSRRLV